MLNTSIDRRDNQYNRCSKTLHVVGRDYSGIYINHESSTSFGGTITLKLDSLPMQEAVWIIGYLVERRKLERQGK